ncbi:hypothetical protein IC582_027244 [Cucumis melo]
MNYERRLKAAAKLILLHDSGSDNSSVSSSDFGVTATLKPYQIDGVQWLIRRYHLGVNVILGDEVWLLYHHDVGVQLH